MNSTHELPIFAQVEPKPLSITKAPELDVPEMMLCAYTGTTRNSARQVPRQTRASPPESAYLQLVSRTAM